MAVPRSKTSRSQRDHRRGHIKITESALSECTNCHALIRPHRVCPECGFYKGVEVVEVKAS
ncbi:MAG: 50S ribosomal protein L32 [SAR324 cluster bacterium]|nr:50S ribosomal protein L32 [SAR324 cluster bacterium]